MVAPLPVPARLLRTRRQQCLLRTSQNGPRMHARTPTHAVEAHITSGRAAVSHPIRPFNIDGLSPSDCLSTLATRHPPVPSDSRMNIHPARARHATECCRMNLGCRAIKWMTHPWTKMRSLLEGELLLSFLRSINPFIVVLCKLVLTIHVSLPFVFPPSHALTFFPLDDPLCP